MMMKMMMKIRLEERKYVVQRVEEKEGEVVVVEDSSHFQQSCSLDALSLYLHIAVC